MTNILMSEITPTQTDAIFARDVAEGLSRDPKRLPTKYHYDALGSKLFEAICELPWYPITRSERILLLKERDAIIKYVSSPGAIIELGSGSGEKVSILAERLNSTGRLATIHLVDISKTALELGTQKLNRYPIIQIVRHNMSYIDGLHASVGTCEPDQSVTVLFLGSNIGNLSAETASQFLVDVQAELKIGDRLLLGTDLVKPEPDLLAAYDDPLGVTAAFNMNLLARINRELDADFDLRQFVHRVIWNSGDSCVESYVVSQREQTVCIPGADCCIRLAKGEGIWTESSFKYTREQVRSLGSSAGFRVVDQWVESVSAFALTLFEVT